MRRSFLSRNKHYNDLNIFVQNRNKSEKKLIFKTVQERLNTHEHIFHETNKENDFNSFYNHIKHKNLASSDILTEMILSNNDFKKDESTNIKTYTSRNNQNYNHSLSNLINNKIKIK